MALNALNAALGMTQNYDGLVLVRDLEDGGTNRFMYFLSLDSNYLWTIVSLLHRPQILGAGQLLSSASSHETIKKRGSPLGSVKQVAMKTAKVYYVEYALNLFQYFK